MKAGGYRVGGGCGVIKGREWGDLSNGGEATRQHISSFS